MDDEPRLVLSEAKDDRRAVNEAASRRPFGGHDVGEPQVSGVVNVICIALLAIERFRNSRDSYLFAHSSASRWSHTIEHARYTNGERNHDEPCSNEGNTDNNRSIR